MIAPRARRRLNTAVIAAAFILIPPAVFWLSVLIHLMTGSKHPLMKLFASMEASSKGVVLLATIVLGCPLFALPLAAIGRWLATVNHERGDRLAILLMLLSTALAVLGLVLPLVLD
jgi:hypothetical protein